MSMIKVAIFGYGTVGCGVADVIEDNKEVIKAKTGLDVEVKYILDIREFFGDKNEDKIVHDVQTIIDDPEISICCETMGGKNAAYTFSKLALEKGKSVCTSNKELVEAYGTELIELAKANKCNYMFEASVGGGIPVIRNINQCLIADQIEGITGILNGTTNYMLTKMELEGAEYEVVLKEAQDKGYAEKDPTADVEGHDAGRKIAILSSLMCGKTVLYDKLYVEGISKISSKDFMYAKKTGMSIKLFGKSIQTKDGVSAMVAPHMVDSNHKLHMVKDVFNGILIKANMLGDFMLYGAGAGSLPTASAVVTDALVAAMNIGNHVTCNWSKEEATLTSIDETSKKFFMRISIREEEVARRVFPNAQVIYVDGLDDKECGVITDVITEKDFKIKKQSFGSVLSVIRIDV
ncbi:MAG: homoserine dehydrogenase [Lachnospiraceae bacterium]